MYHASETWIQDVFIGIAYWQLYKNWQLHKLAHKETYSCTRLTSCTKELIKKYVRKLTCFYEHAPQIHGEDFSEEKFFTLSLLWRNTRRIDHRGLVRISAHWSRAWIW